jgi:phosphotransferase system HPr (HPr) family protein
VRSIELEIRNPSGLHARPAALFVRTAGGQRARIRVRNLTRASDEVDARSLIAVLGLGVSRGHRISVSAEGEDEAAAIEAIRSAVDDGLGEPLDVPDTIGSGLEPGDGLGPAERTERRDMDPAGT